MAHVPPEIESLVEDATVAFRAELTKMLLSNEFGEVAAIVGFNEAKVVSRPEHPVWRRKLQRGHWAVVEKVSTP